MDTDEEWTEDDDLSPQVRAKLFALKTCRNRWPAHAGDLEIAQSVLKMSITLVVNVGSFTENPNDEHVVYPL